jgi:alkylated DNA repair dioxygenase AlkB
VSDLGFQRHLFEPSVPTFDRAYRTVQRIPLDADAWVDHAEGWVSGADARFEAILKSREWKQRSRTIYDQRVLEPRLTAPWRLDAGVPLEPALLEEMRASLSERYQVPFDSVGFNLYRDGRDSVAWHRDRIRRDPRAYGGAPSAEC